ncbi:MAG: SDR family oxidoreductase [Desulfatitalea sp.]|nr:SDR family oxidoreductase [Desulfatitalea sp.]NNK01948.1 SDR family oxidoreductase [Desulfatitalea sp.]
MTTSLLSIPETMPLDRVTSLQDRCAVVTGGSRGLGEAIVRRLVEAGAAVVLTGRRLESLQRVETQVLAQGGKAVGVQADISRIDDSQKVINLAMERFGRVDILVNNAAVFPHCMTMEMNESVWDETIDTDLKGAFFASQFAAKVMIDAGRGGRIINLLSVDGFRPSGLLPAYSAAKAGLWAVTQSMAKEFAEHRILVNAVSPGSTITDDKIVALHSGSLSSFVAPGAVKTLEKLNNLTGTASMPLGHPGYPDDIANAVLFLASDMASYISGACLTVDGAQSLR